MGHKVHKDVRRKLANVDNKKRPEELLRFLRTAIESDFYKSPAFLSDFGVYKIPML